ncbi:hypothetical protein [Priestia aryabhattai]|uniref:hypothetical protein n=1 Tax=Priestia aryabhattai TaxID=412384 RepID=UPI001146042E|nr:hypothetical protein [Priestia aryabhattai]
MDDKIKKLDQQIEKLKQEKQKAIQQARKIRDKERTRRLIHQGAVLEEIWGDLGEENMVELIMKLRFIARRSNMQFFQEDQLDKKIAEFESLKPGQKRSVRELLEIQRKLEGKND